MFSAREALRTSAFWLISLGHGFSLLVVSAVNVHAITHIKEGLGYSLAQATLVFTLVTVGQFFGVMLGWVIGEKFVKRKVAAACMLMHAAGLLMLTYATGLVMLIALGAGARHGLGPARPVHAGDPRRLLRARLDRHDHGAVDPDHGHRQDRRTDTRRRCSRTGPATTAWASRSWRCWPAWGRCFSGWRGGRGDERDWVPAFAGMTHSIGEYIWLNIPAISST